ncbi:oxidoreductase [Streptomyces sp. NBC_00846]|uniref:oxidoreductase n=1 Tax=Streptomyces sp. NBC_00846 TaxID=2975849 RepID=UPI003869C433|nr:oxidoreductase [Streptomyces sp. NBC_00846]
MSQGWNASDIPDQSGRTAVVTGANSGIGLITARELARHGARVLLACRDESRGKEAASRIRTAVTGADVEFVPLDLADLDSVRACAAKHTPDRIDLLINNAGVMALPYGKTADGFERQFGVNHLGHFALTGLLFPKLLGTPGARVVSVSSGMHALSNIDMGDLNSERNYRRWIAYGRSKTANLLFVHELARRLTAAGCEVVAAAAHPGYAATNLQTAGVRMENRKAADLVFRLGNRLVAQPASSGALPTLYAATAPGVRSDSFIGPKLLGWRGAPTPSWRAGWTLNDVASERLWVASEQLTGVTYPVLTT